jgi:hypothetical protein
MELLSGYIEASRKSVLDGLAAHFETACLDIIVAV